MKNKKILNICLLTFGLLTLITFILPIKKFEFLGEKIAFVNVMFYLLNSIMLLALVSLIVFAIINLFKDNYNLIKLMEGMALIGFVMVFILLLIFSCSTAYRINLGYLLVAIEMLVCANFSQMSRLLSSGKEMKENLRTVLPKPINVSKKNKKQKNVDVKEFDNKENKENDFKNKEHKQEVIKKDNNKDNNSDKLN